MEKLIAQVRGSVTEELRLIDQLTELAQETRQAILDRSLEQLKQLSSRHQNAIVRLEILRKAQKRLVRSISERLGIRAEGEVGLPELLEKTGSSSELELLGNLRVRIVALKKLNTENFVLLEKQLAGVKAFRQVIDLVAGVDRIYNSAGAVRRIKTRSVIEEER